MRELEITFAQADWETVIEAKPDGGSLSAVQLLTLLEAESEEEFSDALQALQQRRIQLDLSDLPKDLGNSELAVRLRREEQLAQQGNLLTGLEENDPLRLYLEELAGIPVCGDPQLLAEELAGDKENELLQNRLVELSLSRVVELACEHTGRGVLLMDLIQEGSLGLWQGILGYNGGNFAPERDWWIRQYMAQAIVLQARENGVGQKMRRALEDYRSVDERLLTELGRNPTLEELAEQLHMSLQETAVVAGNLEAARNMHRAKTDAKPEQLPQDEDQAVEDTAYFQMRQRISELLACLSEQDACLLSLRFGLEGGMPLSPEETGKKLRLTPEEVVQKEAAALAMLRNQG